MLLRYACAGTTLACSLILGGGAIATELDPGVAAASATSRTASASPLLAIDRNRATVVDGIVNRWSEDLAKADTGIEPRQLRSMLLGMRSDQLLAASLAGSLEGLRNIVAQALVSDAAVKPSLLQAKALGDAGQDVVYVPVTPCRLVETRGTFPAVYHGGGPFTTNEIRTYTLQGGNGICLTQLPASVAPIAIQMQVFGIPTTSGSGDIEIQPQGGTFGGTATLVYLGSSPFTSASATAVSNLANKQISVQVRGLGAHVAMDVVGYFRPPLGGFLSGITAGPGLTGGTITSSGTISADTGYLQRRVSATCAAGSSIRVIAADGSVTCETNDAGTGTVTSVGTGSGLTGGPITTSGSIAADTTYLQRRVGSTCAVGSSIRAIAADGTVTCQSDNAGPANAYVQNGNAFGATAILGAVDGNALELWANVRSMRFAPDAISGNIIGGHPHNAVSAGVRGATISGGGVASGDSDPDFTQELAQFARSHYVTIGGGYGNRAGLVDPNLGFGAFATIAGGQRNTASGFMSMIGGGSANVASGGGSIIGGGNANATAGTYSGVASGQSNHTPGHGGFIGGGASNDASGVYSAVVGGRDNSAGGTYSLAHGRESEARANYSVALGHRAKTFVGANLAVGAFVWADSQDFDFAQSLDNRFAARATGGVYFVTAIDGAGAATESFHIAPTGNVFSTGEINAVAFNSTSDRNAKTGFAPVDTDATLEAVAALPLTSWSYRSDPDAIRHIGPTAQDFRASFAVGRDERSIATVDADGVALAAIQGLHRRLQARDVELAAQRAEITELKRMMTKLAARSAAAD